MTETEKSDWRRLCALALELVGSQDAFRKEANILKRLVRRWGAQETEFILRGAKLLGFKSLTSLGTAEGKGQRWALEAYWRHENKTNRKVPESVKAILRGIIK